MLIYGAGGHAKVVLSILSACGERISGILDDNWQNGRGSGRQTACAYDPMFMPSEQLIVAIGNNLDRRRVVEVVKHSFGLAIHPTAVIESSVRVGAGVVIVHNAVVQADCFLGNHVIINTAAIVDHECVIGDFAHIGPGAVLCGGVCVGEYTLVGAGSVVLPGICIGRECVIGAGSVVVRDMPDFTKVAGNPARVIY